MLSRFAQKFGAWRNVSYDQLVHYIMTFGIFQFDYKSCNSSADQAREEGKKKDKKNDSDNDEDDDVCRDIPHRSALSFFVRDSRYRRHRPYWTDNSTTVVAIVVAISI